MARKFSCPLLSKEEYDAVRVPLASVLGAVSGSGAGSGDAGTSAIHKVLDEYGFCVIPDVLSPQEVKAAEDMLNKELVGLVDEAELGTMSQKAQDVYKAAKEKGIGEWPFETLLECYSIDGFLCRRGLAHSSFAWHCRFRVRKIYEILHGTTDLASGFDTIMASNNRSLEAKNNSCWPHVDRCDSDPSVPGLPDWEIYQSILYLWSAESSCASTTVVWPGSHKDGIYGNYKNDRASRSLGMSGIHFSQLLALEDPAVREEMYQGWLKNARRVPVPAGGLVIWSSRTTHQGWTGGPRLAQPVCWEPRERRSEQARQRKMLLAALGLPSTHWASLGQPHGHRSPPAAAAGIEFHGRDSSSVGFPLNPTIACYSLDDGTDPESMWYQFRGIDLTDSDDKIVPDAEDLEILENVLRKEVKDVL